MAIITIYQGASGSGEELADAVAQALGCGCISREVLVGASLRYGIPEAKLNEVVEKGPHGWQRFMQNLQPYRTALQAAFCEIALTENNGLVYHGHLGHELLPGFKHVFKVLLTAPMENRVEQVKIRNRLSDSAARRFIAEIDRARSRRLIAMFGADWRDSSRFDLTINLGRMSIEAAKHLICESAHLRDYQMTPASKQAFEDFALGCRVKAVLLLSAGLRRARLDVKAESGTIAVSGTLSNWVTEDELLQKIRQIPGVKEVQSNLVNIPALGAVEWP